MDSLPFVDHDVKGPDGTTMRVSAAQLRTSQGSYNACAYAATRIAECIIKYAGMWEPHVHSAILEAVETYKAKHPDCPADLDVLEVLTVWGGLVASPPSMARATWEAPDVMPDDLRPLFGLPDIGTVLREGFTRCAQGCIAHHLSSRRLRCEDNLALGMLLL